MWDWPHGTAVVSPGHGLLVPRPRFEPVRQSPVRSWASRRCLVADAGPDRAGEVAAEGDRPCGVVWGRAVEVWPAAVAGGVPGLGPGVSEMTSVTITAAHTAAAAAAHGHSRRRGLAAGAGGTWGGAAHGGAAWAGPDGAGADGAGTDGAGADGAGADGAGADGAGSAVLTWCGGGIGVGVGGVDAWRGSQSPAKAGMAGYAAVSSVRNRGAVGRRAGFLARLRLSSAPSGPETWLRSGLPCTTRYSSAALSPVPNGPVPVAANAMTAARLKM